MKNIKVKLFTLTLVSVFIGCNSDFGDMNVDPNNPSEALPDLLLSSALTSMSDVAGAVTEPCTFSTFQKLSTLKILVMGLSNSALIIGTQLP